VNALLAQGYNVVMANASGSAWGNDVSRGQYVAAYEWARSLVAVSSVALVGQSMGGQVALNLLPRREIPNVQAVLLVAPVTSLDDLWAANAGTYSPAIRSAFGVAADGSDFETKTTGYHPEDREGWEFRAVPIMVVTSPADATCHIANAEALIDKIAPYAPEAVLIESTGGHMAAEQFTDAITHGIPFLARYL
jgi:alpha-beta hydrolase superfamily lysophospholipase